MPNISDHHSEEVQGLMGKIPGWIIRWGLMVIFFIFCGVVIGCYYIKYPQIVKAPVIITTLNPPADLLVRSGGRIEKIFVEDGDTVEALQPIALMYTPTDYNAVFAVHDSLTAYGNKGIRRIVRSEWLDNEFILGELQTVFSDFRRQCLDYRYYLESSNIEKKQNLIREQIKKNREYYDKLLIQERIIDSDLLYETKNVARDSALYKANSIPRIEYEQSVRALLQKQLTKENFSATLTNTELSILQQEQQLIELDIQRENEIAEYERYISNVKQQLVSQLEQWRYQYLVVSPIRGKVTFTKYWSSNQSILSGERIASVIPGDSTTIIGRMVIPPSGIGKVEKGQSVNIKINGYPYMEYGMLKGRIENISDVPEEIGGYTAEIILPEGLKTTYHKKLGLIQQIDGTADIITKDQRLIERFLQPVKALFDS